MNDQAGLDTSVVVDVRSTSVAHIQEAVAGMLQELHPAPLHEEALDAALAAIHAPTGHEHSPLEILIRLDDDMMSISIRRPLIQPVEPERFADWFRAELRERGLLP